VPLEYLRFVKQNDGVWTPAAGTFEKWPVHLSELKTLDPCCGSGHFLVAAFLMLVPMRMKMEGLSAREAVDAVLRENIHGLELDRRCVELAAFALAMTAWKYPDAGGYRVLPELNVACSGLPISAKKEEWIALAGDDTNLRHALEELYKQFKDAPVLGSLINPKASLGKGSLYELKWEEVGALLTKALAGEKDDEKAEMSVVARGEAKTAGLLTQPYDYVVTNVPYLSHGKQSQILASYCETAYYDARHDLANVFLERLVKFIGQKGVAQIIMPQNWLYLKRYKNHRIKLLNNLKWDLVARIGEGGFDSTSAAGAFVALYTLTNIQPSDSSAVSFMDCAELSGPELKAEALKNMDLSQIPQLSQLKNPDSAVTFEELSELPLLAEYCTALSGVSTGELNRFTRRIWEVSGFGSDWELSQTSSTEVLHSTGLTNAFFWQNGFGELYELAQRVKHLNHAAQNWQRGRPNWGKPGVSISKMRELKASLYSGNIYAENCCAIIPNDSEIMPMLWAFCSSSEYNTEVRKINQSILVQTKYMINVPFDYERWVKVAEEKYPHGLPKPYSDDPTQWIFHGHPCGSVIWDEETKWTAHGLRRSDATVLQVAVARLLGYRWPAELDADMELADEQCEWVKRCESLLPLADDDGIVCLSAVRGEQAAVDRLEAMLQAAFGDAWSANVRNALLDAVGCAHKSLDFWLREKFFEQHCKLFHHRPFIWHVWDGLNDGFSALLNYHMLDKQGLERLIYTYLDDWIRTQTHGQAEGIDGANIRLQAAHGLKQRLEQVLKGEAPYDIFVRWKPLDQQPIGWNPDINDGVRLNIRPFLTVEDVARRGAGILRSKPNIHWKKDRGKDVASAPWYQLGLEYGGKEGDRINDHHLSLLDKQAVAEK